MWPTAHEIAKIEYYLPCGVTSYQTTGDWVIGDDVSSPSGEKEAQIPPNLIKFQAQKLWPICGLEKVSKIENNGKFH